MKKKYILNKGVITQKIGNKVTIFFGEESKLFTLNETAALIFQGVKLGWDDKKIVNKLVNYYDIDVQIAKKDLFRIIGELVEKKILCEYDSKDM